MPTYAFFWPTYAGHYLHMWAEGHLVILFPKIDLFSYLKGYIFHFNTPQVNSMYDWALNWSWTLEFEYHWGMGARVVRGTK